MSETKPTPRIIEKKLRPPYFQQVWDGAKPFEIRLNDDHYQVGDRLHLREWEKQAYSGRAILAEVTGVVRISIPIVTDRVLVDGVEFWEPAAIEQHDLAVLGLGILAKAEKPLPAAICLKQVGPTPRSDVEEAAASAWYDGYGEGYLSTKDAFAKRDAEAIAELSKVLEQCEEWERNDGQDMQDVVYMFDAIRPAAGKVLRILQRDPTLANDPILPAAGKPAGETK